MECLKKYSTFEELKQAQTKPGSKKEAVQRHNEFEKFIKVISEKSKQKVSSKRTKTF